MTALSASSKPSELGTAPDAAVLAQVADALAWPLLLLQRDATLLHANLAARRLLEQGQPLRLGAQQRLLAAAAARQTEFEAALQVCSPQRPRLLHWPARAGSFTATLTTLPGALQVHNSDAAFEPLLLALTLPPTHLADVSAFARLHTLSDAETRVLQRLAQGENSRRAASALGVSASTVRSQTASLRRKTGHASVPELLRTLAGLPPLTNRGLKEGE